MHPLAPVHEGVVLQGVGDIDPVRRAGAVPDRSGAERQVGIRVKLVEVEILRLDRTGSGREADGLGSLPGGRV